MTGPSPTTGPSYRRNVALPAAGAYFMELLDSTIISAVPRRRPCLPGDGHRPSVPAAVDVRGRVRLVDRHTPVAALVVLLLRAFTAGSHDLDLPSRYAFFVIAALTVLPVAESLLLRLDAGDTIRPGRAA